MDTRTPRTPTGDRSSGFDDAPALSMVKVPSDPAQIIVNHASFRVQLGASPRAQSPRVAPYLSPADGTARRPVVGTAGRADTGAAPAGGRRRAPVVWSGRSAPDDTGASRLLQAVRNTSVGHGDAGSTQVIPRVESGEPGGYAADLTAETIEQPVVGSQRTAGSGETRLLPHMRTVGSAYEEPGYAGTHFTDGGLGDGTFDGTGYGGTGYDEPGYDEPGYDEPGYDEAGYDDIGHDRTGYDGDEGAAPAKRHGADPVRHAYYPGRRMNLGVVLLPMRVFLGFISVYAGMGKLCDPVYFDGGERGSMVKWLNTLHPWEVAEPLRQFALQHPVGAGLVIAFLQVIVGVLTVLGLWQRVAAVVGAGLSAALLVTVSWKSVPVYDAPDIIYLAAWSPLIIAGAPVYSVDGRLAGEAWRRLGPRADIWRLRRRVLRRGALVTTVAVGLTLLIGSVLGGAVRDADRVVVPGPGEAPRNELPGSPLPEEPGKGEHRADPSESQAPTRGSSSSPSDAATTPGAARESGSTQGSAPSQTQGTGQVPPQQSAPVEQQAPSTSSGPSSGGTASGGSGSDGSSGGSGSGGSGGSGGSDRLVGGLLG
ncbi:DoxX family membrane protein [Streptomyces sp. NPDC059785]|uniref:DoxX family membrane protein n=1 Tax=Streptomyces sp. NPDC059785 TaxID=3346945 RepID=UPI0036658D75